MPSGSPPLGVGRFLEGEGGERRGQREGAEARRRGGQRGAPTGRGPEGDWRALGADGGGVTEDLFRVVGRGAGGAWQPQGFCFKTRLWSPGMGTKEGTDCMEHWVL